MIEDGIKTFSEDNYENIFHRDKDVNRLSYLVYRAVHYGFKNQTFMKKKYDADACQLMNYYWLTFHLEAIGDEAKRISRYMKIIGKLPVKEKKEFEVLYAEVKKAYLETMKSYHTGDRDPAYEVASRSRSLIKNSEDFFLRNRDVKWVGYLTNRLKRMVSSIHKLGRIVYQ